MISIAFPWYSFSFFSTSPPAPISSSSLCRSSFSLSHKKKKYMAMSPMMERMRIKNYFVIMSLIFRTFRLLFRIVIILFLSFSFFFFSWEGVLKEPCFLLVSTLCWKTNIWTLFYLLYISLLKTSFLLMKVSYCIYIHDCGESIIHICSCEYAQSCWRQILSYFNYHVVFLNNPTILLNMLLIGHPFKNEKTIMWSFIIKAYLWLI